MCFCYTKTALSTPLTRYFGASGEGFRALQTSIRIKGYAPFLNHNPHQSFRPLDMRQRGFPLMKFKSLPVLLKNMGTLRGFDARHWFRPLDDDQGNALGCDDGERMARPKKQAAEARTEQMNTRYTLAEREYIRSQAAAAGMSESDYVRTRALGHSVSPARSSRADPALVTELNSIGVNVNQLARAVHRGSSFTQYWQEVGAELRTILTKVVASGS